VIGGVGVKRFFLSFFLSMIQGLNEQRGGDVRKEGRKEGKGKSWWVCLEFVLPVRLMLSMLVA